MHLCRCWPAWLCGGIVPVFFLSCSLAWGGTLPPAPLPAAVDAALARAKVPREALAAEVIEVGAALPRLAWRERAGVQPASLMKLVTTYAALELLGPAYTWSTPVYADGVVQDGVLQGDLHLQGLGDPTLVMERLWALLRRVQQLGIQEVRGDIVLDHIAFDAIGSDPAAFDGDPLRPYNVAPDALLINFKALSLDFVPDPARGVARIAADPPLAGVSIDTMVPLDHTAPCSDWQAALKAELGGRERLLFRGAYPLACGEKSWSLAYADPASFNARAVEAMWRGLGGRLGGGVREGVAPPAAKPLHVAVSPPLGQVVRDINKFSNNTMARQLYLTLGLVAQGVGSLETAEVAVRQWAVAKWGEAPELVLDNGAGLSREGRLSAQFLARLLQSAWASPVMPELLASLPIAGVDGTLKRFAAAPGRAHLKTGTLRDVVGVAGYVLAASGRRYVVVAVINHPEAAAARPVLEALVDWAARDEATGTALPSSPDPSSPPLSTERAP
ncbi:D-alanyl-D-alanine carboxypeptidase/D-alanyl-D-alanine endopeptidase [Eleftheria terrae]|uniref:D-alanyl-D-alanine carboxypeptidase/D-alanyl-D-alanine endopeptidase n=1 Tax=Eleftheria terrae TaxID=1597781 RepID=UPI00263BD806|nr:D-alanyl-D-alanine carboxypeptidase/D-alanyl-D-alanine-endopeptidase [Eleftheria terrae]WKB51898.1 D-alanyl-D-alanine carboxypeptidase/D-alanyl-D-alanine-endopeptidase [Eleftheria terrae]